MEDTMEAYDERIRLQSIEDKRRFNEEPVTRYFLDCYEGKKVSLIEYVGLGDSKGMISLTIPRNQKTIEIIGIEG
jgi:hypothetical protein